jgi:type III pantothenate kinase
MLLCIDIGNTNIKFGIFKGNTVRNHWRIATDRARLADEYAMLLFDLFASEQVQPSDITGCAISSVVPALREEFGLLTRRYLKLEPVIVGPEIETGIPIHTDYPSELGPDLIANAVAAQSLYGAPVIAIAFGTATTFVAVSAQKVLEGVAIAPGIITGAESLFRGTATLPQVALARPAHAIGKNTIRSMQSGLVFGFAGLVEGVVRRMRAELGENTHVVATGGLANIIAPETNAIQTVEPDLTLIGIKMIYELNRPCPSAE